jgi:hypothetical protein
MNPKSSIVGACRLPRYLLKYRPRCIGWLQAINEHYQFHWQTFEAAVALFDQFLSRFVAWQLNDKRELLMFAAATHWIAVKLHERQTYALQDLLGCCLTTNDRHKHLCSAQQLKFAENIVCKTLDWHLHPTLRSDLMGDLGEVLLQKLVYRIVYINANCFQVNIQEQCERMHHAFVDTLHAFKSSRLNI